VLGETSETLIQLFRIDLNKFFQDYNRDKNYSQIITFLSTHLSIHSRFSLIIDCIFFTSWKIITILIYILFYWKFNQANQIIFPVDKFISSNKVIKRRPSDIVKVDQLVLEIFQLKIKLNSYLKFIYVSSLIEFVLLINGDLVTILIMCFVENQISKAIPFGFIFITNVFLLSLLILKMRRKDERKQVDIVSGIQRMKCCNNYFNVKNNLICIKYEELEKIYEDFIK
jgi:hypothetical protein